MHDSFIFGSLPVALEDKMAGLSFTSSLPSLPSVKNQAVLRRLFFFMSRLVSLALRYLRYLL
jgi:hypothetical protein